MSKEKAPKGEVNAFMGPGSEFEGKLHFSGSVRLDGKVTGQISSEGLLIIGPSGCIQADVMVETVIICGEVRGEVIASQEIELRPPARVYGTLTTPTLVIHEGVIFEGSCQMSGLEDRFSESGKVAFLPAGPEAAAGQKSI